MTKDDPGVLEAGKVFRGSNQMQVSFDFVRSREAVQAAEGFVAAIEAAV